MLFFFFLDLLADLAAGCTGGAQDKALDGAHEPDHGAHDRTDGKQHRKQQQQRRVILGQARGIFPVGIDDAPRVHRALAVGGQHLPQPQRPVAPRVLHDRRLAAGEGGLHDALGKAGDHVRHDDLVGAELRLGDGVQRVIAHEHAGAVLIGLFAGKIVLAVHHARHGVGALADLDAHARHVIASEQRPRQLLVEQDAVVHVIVGGQVAARAERQRVEQEEIPAHADGLDRERCLAARDCDGRDAGIGVVIEPAALGRFQRGVDQLLVERPAEALDGGLLDLFVLRQKDRDLREAHFARAAPCLCRRLRRQRPRHGVQPPHAQQRQRRQSGVHEQPDELLFRQRRRLSDVFSTAPAHQLFSTRRTCVPASMGLVEVVMTKSPDDRPVTAVTVSSFASSCTSTRVAV